MDVAKDTKLSKTFLLSARLQQAWLLLIPVERLLGGGRQLMEGKSRVLPLAPLGPPAALNAAP